MRIRPLLLTCCLAAASAFAAGTPQFRLPQWPADAPQPSFDLIDVNRQQRSLQDYRGKVVVVFFGFTHCPDVCPAQLLKIALAKRKLQLDDSALEVLFITLDPARDTPGALKAYVGAFDPHFVGLTGTPAQIDRAASAFFVQYARVERGGDYVIDHSTRFAILDARGRLRLIARAETSVDDFTHDIGTLSRER